LDAAGFRAAQQLRAFRAQNLAQSSKAMRTPLG